MAEIDAKMLINYFKFDFFYRSTAPPSSMQRWEVGRNFCLGRIYHIIRELSLGHPLGLFSISLEVCKYFNDAKSFQLPKVRLKRITQSHLWLIKIIKCVYSRGKKARIIRTGFVFVKQFNFIISSPSSWQRGPCLPCLLIYE